MNFKYVIFDFNGTILDDVDLCLSLLNEMLNLKGLPSITKEKYRNIFTFPIIEYYKKAGFTFEGYTFEELATYFIKKYQPASYNCSLYPYLLDLIKILKEKGIKLIVLSASEKSNLLLQLQKLNIYDLFDDILGINDIYAKSKEEIAVNYFKENKILPSDCLMIGDSLHDSLIAKKLGCSCVLFSLGHQSKERLLTSGMKVITSYKELIDLYD